MYQASIPEQTVVVRSRPVCCRTLSPLPTHTPLLTLPVLLLHGLGCSGDAWGPALTSLAGKDLGQRVCAADFPGYGGSPGPRQALGMAEMADWTAALMDQLRLERVHLAGHSMGCQVALELARRYPERVGGIVLIGPTTGEQRVPYWRYVVGLFLDGFLEPLRYNLVLLKMYAQMGLRRYFATVGKMMEDEPLSYAHEIEAACLVLRGERDGIVPDRVARELADVLPRGRFAQVEGAAHALQFDKPAAFATLAAAFWREAEASTPRPTGLSAGRG